jgi:photosystem II stability/assembly factor-like uncharacterized protein
MKKVIYFAILTLLCSCSTDKELSLFSTYTYTSFDTDLKINFRVFYFQNESTGYCATDSGKIYKTINGGVNWVINNTPTNLPIYAISFVNDNIGYAVGGQSSCSGNNCHVPGSVVLKTEDGGSTWVKQVVPYSWSELHSVCFTTADKGFAVGLGLFIKTTDGGKNWTEFSIDYKGYVSKVYFINDKVGFITGLSGNLFRTSDGGDTWSKIPLTTNTNLYDIYFADEKVGYCGGDPHVLKSIDSGKTWSSLDSSATDYFQIYFASESYGFTIGRGHYTGGDFGFFTSMLTETKDGGKTWTNHDNLEFSYPVCFPTKNVGYAFGANRKLYKILIK